MFYEFKGTVNYLQDIVVTGRDEVEHLENSREVLFRLDRAEFRLNSKKCVYSQDKISHLGYIISKNGLSKKIRKKKRQF